MFLFLWIERIGDQHDDGCKNGGKDGYNSGELWTVAEGKGGDEGPGGKGDAEEDVYTEEFGDGNAPEEAVFPGEGDDEP